MKKIFSIFTFLLFCIISNAQSWIPVSGGLNYGGYVNTLFVYDSVMYAGGDFKSPGNNIAQWNGTKWDSLGSGINNVVDAISFYKGNVYAGGYFSRAGGHSAGCIATWNGSAFINAGIDIEGGGVETLQVYDSLLYIGGNFFDSVNHKSLATQGIVSWDGSIAAPMGATGFSGNVSSMSVYKGILYFGQATSGNRYSADLCLDSWNNISYHCSVTNSISNNYFPTQSAIAVCNNRLFVGGTYNILNLRSIANNIDQYNDTTWTSVGSGTNGPIYALASYKNLLFVGGDFNSAGGVPVNNVAMWNGTSWFAVGNGLNGTVYALAIFDSNLYAGGDFTSPGNGIAEFKGPDLGINKLSNNDYNVRIYPNPSDGVFTVLLDHSTLVSSATVTGQPNIIIYNILGEKIYSSALLTENTSIDIGNQPFGVYIYRIVSPNGTLIGSGKLVVE